MRWAGTVLLLLLAGCSGGTSGLSLGQPGLDVARAALRGGSPRVALQVTNDLLAKQPNDEQALIIHGDALTALGEFDEAALDYTKVLRQDPTSVQAHIGMGRLRLPTDPAAAEGLFLEALQNDPRNTTALNDLGIARDLQGNHAGAQLAYTKALGVNPDLHAAQVNLALSLAMSGDSNRALQLLQPLASQPGASVKLRHDLAAVLAMGGKQAEAERILSADLTPQQIQQALADYVAARTGAPVPLPPADSASVAPAYPPPAARQSASPPDAPPPVVPQVTQPSRTPQPAPALPPPAAGSPAASPAVQSPRDPQPRSAAEPSSAEPSGAQAQLTAVPTKAEAQAAWQRLETSAPQVMADRTPMFIKVVRGSVTFWRLRTGFTRVADAQAFCARIRAAGSACVAYEDVRPEGNRPPLPDGSELAGRQPVSLARDVAPVSPAATGVAERGEVVETASPTGPAENDTGLVLPAHLPDRTAPASP